MSPRVAGVLSAACGTCLVMGLLLGLNGTPPPPPEVEPRAVSFEVQPRAKPPVQDKPTPKRIKRRRQPPPPIPTLGNSMRGLSFGLAGLEGLGLEQLSDGVLGPLQDVVMTQEAVDEPPRAISRVAPSYPARARAKGVTGSVTLTFLVGVDGSPQEVSVLESEPPGVFDRPALDALRGWRFQPGIYEGAPVVVRVRQTLRFELG